MEFIWIYTTTLLDDTEINFIMEDAIDYDYLLDRMIERPMEEN